MKPPGSRSVRSSIIPSRTRPRTNRLSQATLSVLLTAMAAGGSGHDLCHTADFVVHNDYPWREYLELWQFRHAAQPRLRRGGDGHVASAGQSTGWACIIKIAWCGEVKMSGAASYANAGPEKSPSV